MPLGVLYDEVGNLVQEHGTEVVLLQEVMRRQPGILSAVIRELHGGPSLVHFNGEDKVVLLRRDQG